MASLETAFEQVAILAEDFKNNEKYYILPEYSEAQARKDFIDKFFIALGWDVNHEDQKDPYRQEVKVERGVSVKGAQRRADYSFSIAPNYRDPKFFVEAKKPSRQLESGDDYFQAIRYGWNTQNPLVVLTDFEEFHILDSRFKPDLKYILNYCHQKYRYTDYLDKEKFKKIYYLFSREAVENNSIDSYAKELPKPKGKKGIPAPAVKSFDQSFLDELDQTRESLARAFKKKNNDLTSEELTEATQRVIDRLVFIRFLEDKLIEGERHISRYCDSKNSWQDFIKDCRTFDAKYNGIVFKYHNIIDGITPSSGKCLTLPLSKGEMTFYPPDNKEFSDICADFSHVNSPYDFNFIPIHILGSIYERFLGKVVHATAKQVRVEEKPEVRKAGGVYYTPQYIVKYIVDNTVGKIINGETKDHPDLKVTPPYKGGDKASPPYKACPELASGVEVPRWTSGRGGHGLTPKQISKLRFADISCGSGSFLITVFDTLLQYHGSWYQSHPKEAKADGCILKDGKWILSLRQKRDILINNIYGVDIDYQAVEVTQLSLFLKLLEDETLATAHEMQTLFKERILPDLSNNIVCGNSLIGTDIYDGELFAASPSRLTSGHPSLSRRGRENLPLTKAETKTSSPYQGEVPEGRRGQNGGSELDERKINAMNFEDRFPHIFKSPVQGGQNRLPLNEGECPDGHRGEGVSQGFDAIVGNPPYVKIQALQETNAEMVNYLKKNYYSAESGNYDLYVTFIERGISLISKTGLFGYIVPHKFFNSNYGKNLRKYLISNKFLEKIINFGDNQIFSNATTYTCLLFLSKNAKEEIDVYKFSNTNLEALKNQSIVFKKLRITEWTDKDWNIIDNKHNIIISKLSTFQTLEKVTTNIFQGPKAGADNVFIFKLLKFEKENAICYSKSINKNFKIEKNIIKRYIKGKYIRNYYINYGENEYTLYPYDNVGKLINKVRLQKEFPFAYEYINDPENKKILLSRENGRYAKEWWAYSRPQNMKIIFEEKILTPFNAFRNSFAYDSNADFVFSAGVSGAYGIKLRPDYLITYKYLIGILNSTLIEFIIHNISTCLRGGFYSYENKYIKLLPICTIDFNNPTEKSSHSKMVSLVDQMLKAKKKQMESTTERDKSFWENKCASLDRQIDSLVYELYGLTEEEIKIVEGGTTPSR